MIHDINRATAMALPAALLLLSNAARGAGGPTTDAAQPRSTTGETVNAAIDNALAFGSRLLTLPLSMVLVAVVLVVVILLLAASKMHRIGRPILATRLRAIIYVCAAIFAVYLVDRKISLLQADVSTLKSRVNGDALAAANRTSTNNSGGRALLFDSPSVEKALADHFKGVKLRTSTYNLATDVVQVYIGDPLVQAYIAVVDLSSQALEIKLGTSLTQKTLTSAFAAENNCDLAINGEAGQSPAMNSGLGIWRGNMVYQGKVISREDARIPRPYISFNAGNLAAFTPAAAVDRLFPDSSLTAIWGRLDSITNGVVQTADERYRQPRTAMGISQDGRRLYLLVVDGRQPRYSIGFSRAEVGYLLQAFGAYNAMLCDEGGSSCMYLKQFGGIVNIPSDNNGQERPTYTHFGISMRP